MVARRPARHGAIRPTKWTDERIEAELRAYLGDRDRTDWPTRTAFEADGQRKLWVALRDYGGSLYWAERLGFKPRSQQYTQGLTREEAIEEARRVIARHGRLPHTDTLRKLGYPKLSSYVIRHRGVKRFCATHGLDQD